MDEPAAMRVIPGPDAPDAGEALARFGLATAVRDGVIAIGVVLGLLYLFPVLGQVVSSPGRHGHPQHLAPLAAGLKLQAGTALNILSVTP